MKAATEFAESLLAIARPAPIETNPLVKSIVDGSLSRDALREYATSIACMAVSFPRNLAAVLTICDDYDVRRTVLGNLLEEEGVVGFVPEEGVRINHAKRHGVMALKFARAAGAAEANIVPLAGSAWFREAIASGNWLGAFTYFAVGFEANVPPTFKRLVGPLSEHYGFTGDELEFLIEHFIADERHGVEAAHLIARVARTEEARQRALAAAKRGGLAWWTFHRAAAVERIHA